MSELPSPYLNTQGFQSVSCGVVYGSEHGTATCNSLCGATVRLRRLYPHQYYDAAGMHSDP